MRSSKFETFIGLGLLIIAILGFFLSLILQLPKANQVKTQAQIVPEIPRDIFSSENTLNQEVQKLSVPANVPVTVNGSNLGRSNVFENY